MFTVVDAVLEKINVEYLVTEKKLCVIFTPVTVPRKRLPNLFFIWLHSRVLHWAVTESLLFDHYADHRNLLARYPHGG